jgi:hypothetical protein
MCDEQAGKKFHEFEQVDPPSYKRVGYTSHYDAGANVCYMMIHYLGVDDGTPSISDAVYDAFEGREYASYIWPNTEHKKYGEDTSMECKLKPRWRAQRT